MAFPSAGRKFDAFAVLVKVINFSALGQPFSIFINGSHGQHDVAMGIVSRRIWVMDCKITTHSFGHKMFFAVRSCFSQSWRYFAGGHIPFGRSFSFQGALVIYKYSLAKRRSLPYVQKVGKERKNAWISTLMELEMKYATETHRSRKIERPACCGF